MFDVWGIGMAMTDKKMRFDPADPIMQKTLPDKGGYARLTYEDFYILADRPAISISAGGSVANSLRDLGKMGLKCVFAGKIGRDDEGQFFEKSLQKCSVVSSLSVEAEEHSGICVVLVHDDGEKTVCAKARAAKKLREEDIDFGLLCQSRAVFVEGYLFDQNPQLVKKIVSTAKSCGCKLYLTLADKSCVRESKDLWREVLPGCDVLFGNGAEYSVLDFDESQLPQLCVKTKGADGCEVWNGKKWRAFSARQDVRVLNTNGAGDAFAAGFIKGLFDGSEVDRCVYYGNETAARILESEVSCL